MHRRLFPLALLLSASLASPLLPAQEPVPDAAPVASAEVLSAKLDALLEAECAERGFPGATLAFRLADGRSGAVAAGVADREAERAMAPHDRMLSGSTGKMYVAATALLLEQDGKLDLDDPLSKWLGSEEWFSRVPNHDTITLRQLLRHESGVMEHVQMPEFWAAVKEDSARVWKQEELVAFVLDKPALFPAGEGWSYADTNYILAGMAMERAAGETYYDLLRTRILEPLELAATAPSDAPALPGLVPGYPVLLRQMIGSPEKTLDADGRMIMNPQLEWTGGGVYTNSTDLVNWVRALYEGELLSEASLAAMLDGVPANLHPGARYGLGTVLGDTPHGPVQGHSGWFPGYLTEVSWYAEHGLAVAVQFNTDDVRTVGSLRGYLDAAAAILLDRSESF